MKSNKQRRAELAAKRKARADKLAAEQKATARAERERNVARGAIVDSSKLAPDNSYGVPAFVARGYYEDQPFTCQTCGTEEVWSATQQKWWYEIAKGGVWT